MRPRRSSAVAAAAVCVLLTGCQYKGLQSVSLPGGTGGDNTYKVTVIFDDVLDLVPQSTVHVNDVTVGDVKEISLDGFKARVVCRVKKSTKLPANTVATLAQTSLLGEKFISLGPPPGEKPQGTLADGALIPAERSDRNPEVEEVFSALSALLNGGGLEQLQTINVELAAALNGRESKVRDLLGQLNTLVSGLDQRKSEIVRAVDALDRLTGTLAAQTQTITAALTDIAPGLSVLADERADLTQMLVSLSRLGDVGSRIIRASKDNTVADLQALQPVLGNLAQAGDNLPKSLELLVTYPFSRNSAHAIPGDFTSLHATVDINAQKYLTNLLGPPPCVTPGVPAG
ncbi:MAG: MCE family protein, partial [Actinomycetota bacterium]|nr:MCE family protein [Actinomycetota bacterium]